MIDLGYFRQLADALPDLGVVEQPVRGEAGGAAAPADAAGCHVFDGAGAAGLGGGAAGRADGPPAAGPAEVALQHQPRLGSRLPGQQRSQLPRQSKIEGSQSNKQAISHK